MHAQEQQTHMLQLHSNVASKPNQHTIASGSTHSHTLLRGGHGHVTSGGYRKRTVTTAKELASLNASKCGRCLATSSKIDSMKEAKPAQQAGPTHHASPVLQAAPFTKHLPPAHHLLSIHKT